MHPGCGARQRQGKLKPERQAALAALGFEFDPRSARWESRFAGYAVAVAEGTVPDQQNQLPRPSRWKGR